MATKFSDLKHKASPERMEREGREALEEFEELERIRLGFLRAARSETQVEHTEQSQVAEGTKLESQNDFHLSTLRK